MQQDSDVNGSGHPGLPLPYTSNRHAASGSSQYSHTADAYDLGASLRRNMPLLQRLGPESLTYPPVNAQHSHDLFGNHFDALDAAELDHFLWS